MRLSHSQKARTVTKATTFLSIASTRFRALQQLATKSLEDIYEDEPGETKESKVRRECRRKDAH